MTKRQFIVLNEITKKLTQSGLNTEDIIEIIGNLCYETGVAIAELDYRPKLKEITEVYPKENTIDLAFMLTGFNILTWKEGWDGRTTQLLKRQKEEQDE